MHILAHRGYWQSPDHKNTRDALQAAFMSGFGAETDVRDLDGQLVISHDMPRSGALQLAVVLDDYVAAGQPGMLALNIKSDGLASSIRALLKAHNITRYFCFDMSVPDTLSFRREGLCFAARLSEYEAPGPLARLAPIIWFDRFHDAPFPTLEALQWLGDNKSVCLVSPELHSRAPEEMWEKLAALPPDLRQHPGLMLCTDLPEQAGERLL